MDGANGVDIADREDGAVRVDKADYTGSLNCVDALYKIEKNSFAIFSFNF